MYMIPVVKTYKSEINFPSKLHRVTKLSLILQMLENGGYKRSRTLRKKSCFRTLLHKTQSCSNSSSLLRAVSEALYRFPRKAMCRASSIPGVKRAAPHLMCQLRAYRDSLNSAASMESTGTLNLWV